MQLNRIQKKAEVNGFRVYDYCIDIEYKGYKYYLIDVNNKIFGRDKLSDIDELINQLINERDQKLKELDEFYKKRQIEIKTLLDKEITKPEENASVIITQDSKSPKKIERKYKPKPKKVKSNSVHTYTEKDKLYYETHKKEIYERNREYMKQYYENNKEEILKKQKEYRKDEEVVKNINQHSKEYYEKHKEEISAKRKEKYKKKKK